MSINKEKNLIICMLLLLVFILTAFSTFTYSPESVSAETEENGYVNLQFLQDVHVHGTYSSTADLTIEIRWHINYPVYDGEIISLNLADIEHTYNSTTKQIDFPNGINISRTNAELEKLEGYAPVDFLIILGDYEFTPPGTWDYDNWIVNSHGGIITAIFFYEENITYTIHYPEDYIEDELYYYAFVDLSDIKLYISLANDDRKLPGLIYNSPLNVRVTLLDDRVYWLKGYANVNLREFKDGVWRAAEVTTDVIKSEITKFIYDQIKDNIKYISITLQYSGTDIKTLRTQKPSEGLNSSFDTDITLLASEVKIDIPKSNEIDRYVIDDPSIWDRLKDSLNDLGGWISSMFGKAFNTVIIIVIIIAIGYLIIQSKNKK